MKILKYLLFVIVGLIVFMLIIALFVSKSFHAGSQITINRPATEVFDYVSSLKNQGNYDAWSQMDPNIQKQYSGTDKTVGFTYEWKSKKVGDGKQVISRIDPGKRIEMDLFFNGSDKANKSFIEVVSVGEEQSLVMWEIDGSMPYPFNIMGLFFDMNKDFDQGLKNLKAILESDGQ